MAAHLHYRLVADRCSDGNSSCTGAPNYNPWVLMGPISGLSGVAGELMRHLGHDPADHPAVLIELEQAIGEEMLDTGREVLTGHGLTPRDAYDPSVSLADLEGFVDTGRRAQQVLDALAGGGGSLS
jgi:hypothetical protein